MHKIFTLLLLSLLSFTASSQIHISQVYPGGGNTGAAYNQDFVEIYNSNAGSVILNDWSIQYSSAAGTGDWTVIAIPNGTVIDAGGYFLIGLGAGANGAALPAPDLTAGTNLSGTAGKIALVSSITALSGPSACSTPGVVDLIGYGSTASCSEGSPASVSGLTSTESLLRKSNGCIDGNDNSSDFEVGPVSPRNSAAAAYACTSNPTLVVSAVSGITTVTGNASAPVAFNVYGAGLLNAPGNINVSASGSNFEISLSSGSGFGSSVVVPYTGESLAPTPVYLRIKASAPLGAVTTDVTAAGATATTTTTMKGNVLVPEPNTQASNIVTSNITDTSVTINWTNGNGAGRAVVINTSAVLAVPAADAVTYNDNSDFRSAPNTATGNRVVFSGAGSGPITVIGLAAGSTYTISVYEYDGGTGTINYLTNTNVTNPVSFTTSGVSPNLTQVNFKGLAVPLYCGSGASSRTPTMYFAKVTNLVPNTTYKYYTQAAATTDFGTTTPGAGNPILFDYTQLPVTYFYASSPSLNTTGSYGRFKTDATGSFSGSFGFVNTGNARFAAGNTVYPSIVLAPEGNTAVQYRFALNQSITTLAFSTMAGANNGTFIQGASFATPGNLVALWDNTTATGRPTSVTLAENPAIGGTATWGASFIAGYSSTAGSWNTIIPNSNANGTRLIQQIDKVTGVPSGCNSDDDGTWPTGTVVTASPAGGATALVIDAADAPLTGGVCFDVVPVRIEYVNVIKTSSGSQLKWKVECLSNGYIKIEVQRGATPEKFVSITSITASQLRCGSPFDYVDAAPLPGKNFYRLKITDVDGRVTYSAVLLLQNGIAGLEFTGLYPSIVKDDAMLGVSTAKAAPVELVVTDMSGKNIRKVKTTVAAGSNLIKVDCRNLAAGMYNITAFSANQVSKVLRFVKL